MGPGLVNQLMDFYSEQDKICIDCFDNNPNFRFLLTKAFEEEINKENVVDLFSDQAVLASVHVGSSHERYTRSGDKS